MTERAFCGECRTMREVVDQFFASKMEKWGEIDYSVTALDCGHEIQGPDRVVGPAPGAPYAGPSVAPAATSRPRDLRAAHRRQQQLDHPEGE